MKFANTNINRYLHQWSLLIGFSRTLASPTIGEATNQTKAQLVKSNFGFWLEGITGEPRETRSARGRHDFTGQTSWSIVGTKKLNNSMKPGLNWWKASVLTTTKALLRH